MRSGQNIFSKGVFSKELNDRYKQLPKDQLELLSQMNSLFEDSDDETNTAEESKTEYETMISEKPDNFVSGEGPVSSITDTGARSSITEFTSSNIVDNQAGDSLLHLSGNNQEDLNANSDEEDAADRFIEANKDKVKNNAADSFDEDAAVKFIEVNSRLIEADREKTKNAAKTILDNTDSFIKAKQSENKASTKQTIKNEVTLYPAKAVVKTSTITTAESIKEGYNPFASDEEKTHAHPIKARSNSFGTDANDFPMVQYAPKIRQVIENEHQFIKEMISFKNKIDEKRKSLFPQEVLNAAENVYKAILDEYTECSESDEEIKKRIQEDLFYKENLDHAKYDLSFISRIPRTFDKRDHDSKYAYEIDNVYGLIKTTQELITQFNTKTKDNVAGLNSNLDYLDKLKTLKKFSTSEVLNVATDPLFMMGSAQDKLTLSEILPGHGSLGMKIGGAVTILIGAVLAALAIYAIVISLGTMAPAVAALSSYFGYSLFTGLAAAIGVETTVVAASTAAVAGAAMIAGSVTTFFGTTRGLANAAVQMADVAYEHKFPRIVKA